MIIDWNHMIEIISRFNKILDYLEVKKAKFDWNQLNYNQTTHFNFNQIVIKSVQMIIDWTDVTFQMRFFKIILKL